MDKYIIDIYGAENLSKVKTNMKEGIKESRRRFVKKYPYAKLDKFEFSTDLKKNGDIDKYTVFYKIDDVSSYDITSDTFLNNAVWQRDLYWVMLLDVHGTVRPYVRNPVGTQYKINSFRVYVTNNLFFDADFEAFNIHANISSNDIRDNSYLAAIFAAYIATYSCGICTQHFEYNDRTPRIITSVARYHLYYTMKRFLRYPEKMSRYITRDMRSIIMRNKPAQYEWSKEKFHYGKDEMNNWISEQPRGTVRNVRPVMSKNGVSGQIGLKYEKRGILTVKGHLDDYKLFIATKSFGLTRTGQLLFQQSVEIYVYSVLGAQASTRWPIAGGGALSIQTQDVYLKKAEDTIIQDDQTLAIRNMRTAIGDTKVVLNMAISPGMILIPSNMIILTEAIPGYNNVLTRAESGMRFGVNDAVNYLKVDSSDDDEPTTPVKPQPSVERPSKAEGSNKPSPTAVSDRSNDVYGTDLYLLIIALIGGSLVSRYII